MPQRGRQLGNEKVSRGVQELWKPRAGVVNTGGSRQLSWWTRREEQTFVRLRTEKGLCRGGENGKQPSVFGDLGEVWGYWNKWTKMGVED